jgi:hypothetical protein
MCKTLSGSCPLVTNMKVGSKRRVMLPHSSRFSALKDDTVQFDLELVGIAKGASHPRKQCPRVSAFGAVKRFGLMRSSESFPSLTLRCTWIRVAARRRPQSNRALNNHI